MGTYPRLRLRRNRKDDWTRRLVREHHLTVNHLIWPLFVCEGQGVQQAVPSMPGVFRWSIDGLVEQCKLASDRGLPAVALFPVVGADKKSEDGSEAWSPDNLVSRAVRAVKQACPNLGVICDVALDPYTTHGQDGVVRHGDVVNDETVEALCKQALAQARAGCDVVAPSDMMDGRVGAIREALEAEGFVHTRILAYAAKYASSFYGPFRDAVGSKTALGSADKRTYQMDPANGDEALREVELDIREGADMVMIKPGLPYLDIIRRVKDAFHLPTFAYQVSGEYAMLRAASERGWLVYRDAMSEALLCMHRAGADAIFTYAAIEAAEWLAD
jgi:porphobilinogen synthase